MNLWSSISDFPNLNVRKLEEDIKRENIGEGGNRRVDSANELNDESSGKRTESKNVNELKSFFARRITSQAYDNDKLMHDFGVGSRLKDYVASQEDYTSTSFKNISLFKEKKFRAKGEISKGWATSAPTRSGSLSKEQPVTEKKAKKTEETVWPCMSLPKSITDGLDAGANTLILKITASKNTNYISSKEEYSSLFTLDDLITDPKEMVFSTSDGIGLGKPFGLIIKKATFPKVELNTYKAKYGKQSVVVPTKRIKTQNLIKLSLLDNFFGKVRQLLLKQSGYKLIGHNTSHPNDLPFAMSGDDFIKPNFDKTNQGTKLDAILYTVYYDGVYDIKTSARNPYVYPIARYNNIKFVNFTTNFEMVHQAEELTFSCDMIFQSKENVTTDYSPHFTA